MRVISFALVVAVVIMSAALPRPVTAQTRIMPLGDSITQGGQGYVSYRYPLWFDLDDGGYLVDFVGRRDFINGNDPNLDWYPEYAVFDPDHEGYWGWRTDEIAGIVFDAATEAQPDIVLVHLGTNDIGQQGAAGVTNADANLRTIIATIRSVTPAVTFMLAQVIPIGEGTSYFNNADQVEPLNAVIAAIVADESTEPSPVILIDQNTGFDLGTMMQSDGLHPNLVGEARIAEVWGDSLAAILDVVNVPPSVTITTPTDGASFTAPGAISVEVDATDSDGAITEVRFYAGGAFIDGDTSAPYAFDWLGVQPGAYTLTAEADDDGGATRTSSPVVVYVVPGGSATSIPVTNPSFEDPLLPDGDLASGPGVVGGWTFAGTPDTFVGIFNPPAGSYPDAAGNNPPAGADSANVAFLFNDGTVANSVSATLDIGETLLDDMEYVLRVAIGRFLPDQPYVFSTFGGYTIELLAGTTVIARDTDSVLPAFGRFRDAVAWVSSSDVDPGLLGQPLSIRLDISAPDGPRSSHFDDVRLTRHEPTVGVPDHGAAPRVPVAAWPNPFRAGTTIFGVREGRGPTSVRVFDLAGRSVPGVSVSRIDAERVSVGFASSVAPGVYLAVVASDEHRGAIKLVRVE